MSWRPAPPRAPAPWYRTVMGLFSSDRAITSEGVGANLVEMLAELVHAIDACTVEIKRFNDWTERQQ